MRLILFAVCAGATAAGAPAFLPSPLTVPMRVECGLIMVDGRLDGKGPFTWIVDTGASRTIVTPACAAQLLAPDQASRAWHTRTLTARTLSAGSAELRNVAVVVMDPPQAAALRLNHGVNYHGLLGYPFLSQFVTTFDYPARCIRFEALGPIGKQPRRPPTAPGDIPVRFVSNLPHVEATLAGQGPLTMVIDTGASENMLTPEAAARIGLTVPAGDGGIPRVNAGECRVGTATLRDMPAVVHRLMREGHGRLDYDGILGTPFLSHFAFTIDYRRAIIRLVPGPNAGAIPAETGAAKASSRRR